MISRLSIEGGMIQQELEDKFAQQDGTWFVLYGDPGFANWSRGKSLGKEEKGQLMGRTQEEDTWSKHSSRVVHKPDEPVDSPATNQTSVQSVKRREKKSG
ncbi:hypothetical protein ILUMI_04596 [Ignelater luminosus]|uniref:Uncharacterized protein n=1 Tax=Ignelater luminosus TaxID=2038154 RepID=A0A8K0DDK5_IGNLU|nr:hypothetical protein ILUMI_04596 [Ignelater luminosus]